VFIQYFQQPGAAGLAAQPIKAWGYDFRRKAVRNLERAGMPRSVAMELVGHRTESVYKRYDMVSEKDLTHGVKTHAAWLAQGKSQGAKQK
jgi:hypothetical protein